MYVISSVLYSKTPYHPVYDNLYRLSIYIAIYIIFLYINVLSIFLDCELSVWLSPTSYFHYLILIIIVLLQRSSCIII